MNISSPRSVRSTSIAGATVISDPEEALAAISVPAVLPVEAAHAVRAGAPRGTRARAPARARGARRTASAPPRKYDDVGHHRAPARRSASRPRRTARGVAGAEQHVVEAVVAVHQPERRAPVGDPAVEARDEALGTPLVLGRDAARRSARGTPAAAAPSAPGRAAIAWLSQGVAPSCESANTGACSARQLVDRQARLLDAAARDLIALARRRDVLEQQREPALVGVDHREVAGRRAGRRCAARARDRSAPRARRSPSPTPVARLVSSADAVFSTTLAGAASAASA